MQADWSVQNRTHYANSAGPSPAFQETMPTKWQEERVHIALITWRRDLASTAHNFIG